MKDELKALKESALKIAKAKEAVANLKIEFNEKVEQVKQEEGIKEVYNEKGTAYDNAKALYDTFKDLFRIIATKKVEDPRYNKEQLKKAALNEYMAQGKSEEFNKFIGDMFDNVVETYFLYEKCGFKNILKKEQEIEELENSVKNNAETILDESKEAAAKLGNSILDIVKPYGNVAKEHLQSTVNKGSKKLIKFLENVENKTNKK